MRLFSTLGIALSLAVAAATAAPLAQAGMPAVTIHDLPVDWYPESLAAGPDGTLYVGSWRQGAVARLAPDGSPPQVLIPPGSNGLANGQGMLVDAPAGLLWVCSGSLGHTTVPTTPSALKSYDLTSGAPRNSYPMPNNGYCNDLAQAKDGTIYVTDSYHPRILSMPRGGKALSVWLEDPQLGSGDTKFYLNGISIANDGSVFASAVAAVPWILRVGRLPSGKAGAIRRITAPRVLKNVDAVRTLDANHLVLFESNAFGNDGPYGGQITLATMQGHRITKLDTLAAGLNDPSSGLIQQGRIWYIESKYGLLLAHPDNDAAVPRHVPFSVGSVALP